MGLDEADRRWARATALVRQPPPRRRWEAVLGVAALVVAVAVVVSGSLVVVLSHGLAQPGSRYLLGLLAFSWVVAGTSTAAALRDRRAARRFLDGHPSSR